jgi:hypothetical protein
MSLEHSPARSDPKAVMGMDGSPRGPPDASDYWQSLIDEKLAAEFLKLSQRTLQGYRYRGGGPKYIALSSRCVRYRRIDLLRWAEAHMRTSTSDPGPEAA